MTKLSALQVAKLTGKSKSTILRLYNKGKLSGQRNEDRSVFFDSSEVLRVFPEVKPENIDTVRQVIVSQTTSNETPDAKTILLQKEIEILKVKLEFEQEKNENLKSQSEKLEENNQKLMTMLERKDMLIENMQLKDLEQSPEAKRRFFGILPPKRQTQ